VRISFFTNNKKEYSMYQPNLLGAVTTVGGVAALPNTGGNELLMVASIFTTLIGLAIVVSTAVRQAAKKGIKA
jgi:hypothetical protein